MTVVGSLITHLGTAGRTCVWSCIHRPHTWMTWLRIDGIVSGKCVLNVLIAHDVFSERIAEAPNAEEEQWEKIKLIITDATLTGIRSSNSSTAIVRLQVLLHLFASTFGMSLIQALTFTGGCLASGYSYAQNLLSQMEPVNSLILCLNVIVIYAYYSTKLSAATQRHLKRWWMSLTTWGHHGI